MEKRKRGRPKGSLGKKNIKIITEEKAIPLDSKEIKRQIRMLRKLKKDIRKKTPERRELNEKIRTLKAKLLPVQVEVTPEKSDIIKKILERRPEYAVLGIVLEGYTIEQLKFHYEKILHKARLI